MTLMRTHLELVARLALVVLAAAILVLLLSRTNHIVTNQRILIKEERTIIANQQGNLANGSKLDAIERKLGIVP